MLLVAALSASIIAPQNSPLTDNLVYALEQAQSERVMYAKCDEVKGTCYARLETSEVWLECDVFAMQCKVTRTKKFEQSI